MCIEEAKKVGVSGTTDSLQGAYSLTGFSYALDDSTFVATVHRNAANAPYGDKVYRQNVHFAWDKAKRLSAVLARRYPQGNNEHGIEDAIAAIVKEMCDAVHPTHINSEMFDRRHTVVACKEHAGFRDFASYSNINVSIIPEDHPVEEKLEIRAFNMPRKYYPLYPIDDKYTEPFLAKHTG
jgi:hypothetical protein